MFIINEFIFFLGLPRSFIQCIHTVLIFGLDWTFCCEYSILTAWSLSFLFMILFACLKAIPADCDCLGQIL